MKKIFALLGIITLFTSCIAEKKEFTIIGKWKAIEATGSNGANQFQTDIEDGNEIIFKKDNIVIDHFNNKGKYEILGDSLHLIFLKEEFFYFCHSESENSEKMSLIPLTAEYKLICDEGCSTIYKKIR